MTQAQTPNGKLLAKTAEAATYSGWNRIKLQDLVRDGALKNYGSSTRILIAWRDLDAMIGGQK